MPITYFSVRGLRHRPSRTSLRTCPHQPVLKSKMASANSSIQSGRRAASTAHTWSHSGSHSHPRCFNSAKEHEASTAIARTCHHGLSRNGLTSGPCVGIAANAIPDRARRSASVACERTSSTRPNRPARGSVEVLTHSWSPRHGSFCARILHGWRCLSRTGFVVVPLNLNCEMSSWPCGLRRIAKRTTSFTGYRERKDYRPCPPRLESQLISEVGLQSFGFPVANRATSEQTGSCRSLSYQPSIPPVNATRSELRAAWTAPAGSRPS